MNVKVGRRAQKKMEENLVHSKLSPLKQEITQTHNQIASSHSLQLGSPRFISISANDYTN